VCARRPVAHLRLSAQNRNADGLLRARNCRAVHNIMLSPYTDYTVGSEQYTWLLNDLRALNRTATPWVRHMAGKAVC